MKLSQKVRHHVFSETQCTAYKLYNKMPGITVSLVIKLGIVASSQLHVQLRPRYTRAACDGPLSRPDPTAR